MHWRQPNNPPTTEPRQRAPELTRREFVQLTTLAGAGLTLGVCLPDDAQASAGRAPNSLAMPFLRIAPDDTVTLICKHTELGQGVWTGLSAILAEELDAAWDQMRVEQAPAQVPQYGNIAFGGFVQVTGGSTSVINSWLQLRQAGATARAMLVQAAATKWRVPTAEITVSDGVVAHGLSGRKARFGELAARAARLPVPTEVKLKEFSQFKLLGREDKLPRLDSRAKSSGTQQYAIDVLLPGMVTAVVLRPPRFGARVASFDASQTRKIDGVLDVVQIPQGVAVVGRDMWSAKQGRAALLVDWDESHAEKRGTAQLLEEYRRLARQPGSASVASTGDIESAFKQCVTTIETEFEFPYLAHAPMEPLTAVCLLQADRCEIWAGAQNLTLDQQGAASILGFKPEQVVFHIVAAGGAFGRRGGIADSDYLSEVVAIAKATGGKYPVRLIWTREDDLAGGWYRPLNYHWVKAGVDAQGKLIAFQQRVVGQSLVAHTALDFMVENGVDPMAVEGNVAQQYDVANVDITWTEPKVGVPVMWWRSVGHSHMGFSKEVIVDELAEAAGQDPVAFRIALLKNHPKHVAVLKLVAERAGWSSPFPKTPGRGRGVAVHEAYGRGTVVAAVAEVTVAGDAVTVDRLVCAIDCGLAITPDIVRAQVESCVAWGLSQAFCSEITLTDGRVDQQNFHHFRVLRLNETPRIIEAHILPSTKSPSGVGESAAPPIAPAVANAIRAATGIRLRKLPFDLSAARADTGDQLSQLAMPICDK